MSKLTPKKFSKRQIEYSKRIEEMLNGWGFQHYVRHCEQPSKDYYGESITVIEEWSNEDMADFIVKNLLKLAPPTNQSNKDKSL